MRPRPAEDPTTSLVPVDFDPFAEPASTASVPLSEAQREIWTAVQMGPHSSSVHNYCYLLRLTGAVSVTALRSAVQELFNRHEALRTIFDEQGVHQITLPPQPVDVPVEDLTALPEAEREARIGALLAHEVATPFDLVNGPPSRARIVLEAPDRCSLAMTAHHVVCDGRSFQLLIEEAVQLHDAARRGAQPLLPAARPFGEFLRNEASDEGRAEAAAALAYWRRRFSDGVPVLDLPSDFPRPPVRTFAGARRSLRLDAALTAALKHPPAQWGTTTAGLLLAAFYALLYRLTGQSALVVGLPISMWDGSDPMVGHTTNFVPLRVDLDPLQPLSSHLLAVREALLDAHEHRAVTFGTLVRELNPPREPGRVPLVSVVFNVDRGRRPPTSAETSAEVVVAARSHVGFELEVDVVDEGRTFALEFSYNTDLFSAETIDRWLGCYSVLLAGVAAARCPGPSVADLPILDEPSRRRVLIDWSGAGRPDDAEPALLVHQAFEQQAARRPEQPAVVWEGGVLTYEELNARANRLARRLRARGVVPDERVGLMLPRSPELIVALLAVLKAGGAYVPLEPGYPRARVITILDDASVRIVISAAGLCPTDVPGVEVWCLDSEAFSPADAEPGGDLEPVATEADLAYVIYTSGSTGVPKGVMIEHRSLAAYVADTASREFRIRSDDRVLQFAAISFDTAAEEIYPTLGRGATLVLRTDGMSNSLEEFATRCRDWGVTILDVPTAFWHELAAGLAARTVSLPPQVRLVAIGGERALPERVEQWCQAVPPGVRLLNGYGPTETTILATWCDLVRDGQPVAGAPIGYPIPGTRTYVLDVHGNPVPPGVIGELYIGGRGLARGYLGRPDLTAERFVPDPFTASPGARLYRTGDLVRHLPDGSLAFVGRVGQQVKVRGFRIELEEIESTLRRHPAVRDAVVTAPASASGVRSLVGYVVPQVEAAPTPHELKRFLSETLPEYMVPPTFVPLAALPLTVSGKIDYRALPSPDLSGAERPHAAPRNPVEELLFGVWRDVLGLNDVGIHDDFFELGGDSIKSLQVMTRAAAAGIRLTAEQVFRHRSIATLAAASQSGVAARLDSIPRRAPGARRVLSAAERRLWFFDQLEPGSAAYNLGVRLHFEGTLDLGTLERSLSAVVERHETLRTRYLGEAGVPFATVAPPPAVQLPVFDLRDHPSQEREAEAERVVAADAERPFDLGAGPLFRALLVRIDQERHILGLTLHHIASDGWSVDVFARELLTAYQAFAEGRAPALPPLPIRYADFAAWESEWLEGGEAERQLSYWRGRLAGSLPVVDLPADRPRPATQTYRGGSCALRLRPQLTEELAALSRAQGVTPFMTHLAAFGLLLQRLTGLEDLPVGVPVAGRGRDEVEGLIGIFVNTVVIRHDLSGDPTFLELLRRTRTLALDAYRNSQLPFDRLVEVLQPQRAANRSPLFQVLINSVDFSQRQRFELPGLVAEFGGNAVSSSKFDLTLYLGNEGGATELVLAYNADLFLPARMEELLRAYELLLQQVVSRPDRRTSEVSLLTASARAVLPDPMLQLGGTVGPTVIESVISQARRAPERIAISDPQASLSYAQVERLSRTLACDLAKAGISKGDVVAIHARRGPELVWALLGVLRAGAAFAILDAAHPAPRIADCVRAIKPRGWLHSPGLEREWQQVEPAFEGRPLAFRTELSRSGWAGEELPDEVAARPTPEDVAYVAFTSGTTGGVKGIVGTHGPVSHFVDWHVKAFGLTPDDRFSMLSGLSHDPLLRDVFTPLHLGAALCIPEPDAILSPGELRRFMARERITAAHLTPSHVHLLTEGAAAGELPRLRYAFLGGDALTRDTVAQLQRVAPAATVVNFYGATETPQAMGWHVLPRDEREERATLCQVPLGRGIDGVQLLVLRGNGQLAGIGELGEIAVRTPHLARGYLGDEALTRERFIASPFSGDPSDRIYRTGDLGRFRPDGLVEFAGRRDSQIKIRGFRVELQAVESTLREHPAVRSAAVLHDRGETGGPGEPQLAAYVARDVEEQVTPAELRAFLQARLPDYMVPALFVILDSLPLNPNGKVDRKALAGLQLAGADGRSGHVAPSTPTQKAVAAAWEEVLATRSPGIHDNFFDAGGHSLSAARLIARLQSTFGLEVGLRSLFERPTIAGLSELIDVLAVSQGSNGHEVSAAEREEFEL